MSAELSKSLTLAVYRPGVLTVSIFPPSPSCPSVLNTWCVRSVISSWDGRPAYNTASQIHVVCRLECPKSQWRATKEERVYFQGPFTIHRRVLLTMVEFYCPPPHCIIIQQTRNPCTPCAADIWTVVNRNAKWLHREQISNSGGPICKYFIIKIWKHKLVNVLILR